MAPGEPRGTGERAGEAARGSGLVVFAYDGSVLAELAIQEAASQLAPGRDALVVCVWQPANVGFEPTGDTHFDANDAKQVCEAAEQTAAHGASLASGAGFRAQSAAVEAAPTWKGIEKAADEHHASLIVLGSHKRSGIARGLLGSVAGAVVSHSERSVLVVHRGD